MLDRRARKWPIWIGGVERARKGRRNGVSTGQSPKLVRNKPLVKMLLKTGCCDRRGHAQAWSDARHQDRATWSVASRVRFRRRDSTKIEDRNSARKGTSSGTRPDDLGNVKQGGHQSAGIGFQWMDRQLCTCLLDFARTRDPFDRNSMIDRCRAIPRLDNLRPSV